MRRLILFLFLPIICQAQAWSGIIDPTRAVDWSHAGVQNGIPSGTWPVCNNTACNNLAPGGAGAVTSANIVAAVNGAQVNGVACSVSTPCVVPIRAGTFTGLAFLHLTKSGVAVRGQGANQTILKLTGTGGVTCWGSDENVGSVTIDDGSTNCGFSPDHSTTIAIPGNPANTQGVTTLTFTAVSGLTVGQMVTIDQNPDTVASGTYPNITVNGYPTASDTFECATTSCTSEGGGNFAENGTRIQSQTVIVTQCGAVTTQGAACSGSNVSVTFSPGLYMPNYRSGQTPHAWWGNTNITLAGIENMTLDITGNGQRSGIGIGNALNVWVKGNRIVACANTGAGGTTNGCPNGASNYATIDLPGPNAHVEIRDNYLYGNPGGTSTRYGITAEGCTDCRVENNILEYINSPLMANDWDTGTVYGYNFGRFNLFTPTFEQHNSGELMVLVEGMDGSGIWPDNIHGTGGFLTTFRNYISGDAGVETPQRAPTAFILNGFHRFINVIGNVAGASFYSAYQTTNNDNAGNEVYALNWNYNSGGTGNVGDSATQSSLMRWGNWDSVTSTNKTGTNDSTGTRFVSSEVPSGIANYSNALPSSHNLPSSFYLPGQPSWWATPYGTPAFPPIGPDVVNGNVPNNSTTPTGGHANKIPARLCWENTSVDPAYPSTNPQVRLFNSASCYAPPPPPPALSPSIFSGNLGSVSGQILVQ